jgi:acetoin utilization deacetylase AcuC-like enzyme
VINLHEHPRHLYPGTGFVHERGEGAGEGFTLNIPLDPGSGDEIYRHAMVFHVMPALQNFDPQLLLVSAGFDAAASDPLAHMEVTPAGFDWICRFLKQQATVLCEGRMIAFLEGGYELDTLARGVRDLTRSLLEEGAAQDHMAAKTGFF